MQAVRRRDDDRIQFFLIEHFLNVSVRYGADGRRQSFRGFREDVTDRRDLYIRAVFCACGMGPAHCSAADNAKFQHEIISCMGFS